MMKAWVHSHLRALTQVLVALAWLLPAVAWAQSPGPRFVEAKKSYNARVGPEKNAPKVFFVQQGEALRLVAEETPTWWLVENQQGVRGYYPKPILRELTAAEISARNLIKLFGGATVDMPPPPGTSAPDTDVSVAAPPPPTVTKKQGKTMVVLGPIANNDVPAEKAARIRARLQDEVADVTDYRIAKAEELSAVLGPEGFNRLLSCPDPICYREILTNRVDAVISGKLTRAEGGYRLELAMVHIGTTGKDTVFAGSLPDPDGFLKKTGDIMKILFPATVGIYTPAEGSMPGTEKPSRGLTGKQIGGIVAGGVGVAALGAGVAFTILQSGASSDYEALKEESKTRPVTKKEVDDKVDEANQYMTFSLVGYGVAAAAAVTSVVLLVTGAPAGDVLNSDVSVSPVLLPGGGSFNVKVRF